MWSLFLILVSDVAWSLPNLPKTSQGHDLQAIQEEVKRLEGGLKSGRETEASLSAELTKLEKLLKLQALEIQLSTIEWEKLEAHVQEMTVRKDSLQQNIDSRRARLRQMLSLLPTLETRSPLSHLTEDDGAYLSLYRETVSKLLKKDREEILALKKFLDEVDKLNGKLTEEKEKLVAHTEDLKEKQEVLSLNQKLKLGLLKKTRSEQTERLRAYQSAKAAESELESMLSKFNLAAEMNRQSTAEVSSFDKRSVNFATRKGALSLPSVGKIVTSFGRRYDPKTSLYTFHKGVDIKTSPAAAVKAIFPGKIVFSGRIGGYGQLLILDHGDQYFSLVGQLGEVLKKEGESVREGDVIGLSSSDNTPLYFEIRQRHIAVNPLPWLANKSDSL